MSDKLSLLLLCSILLLLCCERKETPFPINEPNLKLTVKKLGSLPSAIKECSGFCLKGNQLLVINDGGVGPQLYFVDTNTITLSTQRNIPSIKNIDWEALDCTTDELIIGDFGNNFGARKDLTIYHLDKQTFTLLKTIPFVYPNQVSFDEVAHNFDCEAMIIRNEQYHLFTKNRGNNQTNLYTASIHTGGFMLQDSIEVAALVTDAYYHSVSEKILLLENKWLKEGVFESFIQIIEIDDNFQLKTIATLDLEIKEQLEAITLKNGNEFYVGSEAEINNGGNLYLVIIEGL